MAQARTLPGMPEIGRPEHYYVKCAREAEHFHDHHAREAAKVGQYVTRATLFCSTWEDKERCYKHALRNHCVCPIGGNDALSAFYASLAHLVREYAGVDLLRHASALDDRLAQRLAAGEPRSILVRDAHTFFHRIFPIDHKPEWLNMVDFQQLRILRQQWS